MSRKLELKIPVEKQPMMIVVVFIIVVILSLVALYPLVSKSISNNTKLEESSSRLSTLQNSLNSERNRMNKLRQAQEEKTGQALNLKNTLSSMLWENSKDVKYYLYDLAKTLKVSIVSIGTESSLQGTYFTTVDYPLQISGNYISVLEYINMIENSDDLLYVGQSSVKIDQTDNGKVLATFTVEADTQ